MILSLLGGVLVQIGNHNIGHRTKQRHKASSHQNLVRIFVPNGFLANSGLGFGFARLFGSPLSGKLSLKEFQLLLSLLFCLELPTLLFLFFELKTIVSSKKITKVKLKSTVIWKKKEKKSFIEGTPTTKVLWF